jgi:predicted esterase
MWRLAVALVAALGLPTAAALNILALHGGGQSAASFRSSLQPLEAALGPGHTFVYAAGPYPVDLWIRDPPGGKAVATIDPNWAAASFAVLDNLVSTQGPFDGIVGYSQGGAMTVTYLSQASALGTFRFAVTFCGCTKLGAPHPPRPMRLD